MLARLTCQGSGIGPIPMGRRIDHPARITSSGMALLRFPQPREFPVKFLFKYR